MSGEAIILDLCGECAVEAVLNETQNEETERNRTMGLGPSPLECVLTLPLASQDTSDKSSKFLSLLFLVFLNKELRSSHVCCNNAEILTSHSWPLTGGSGIAGFGASITWPGGSSVGAGCEPSWTAGHDLHFC